MADIRIRPLLQAAARAANADDVTAQEIEDLQALLQATLRLANIHLRLQVHLLEQARRTLGPQADELQRQTLQLADAHRHLRDLAADMPGRDPGGAAP